MKRWALAIALLLAAAAVRGAEADPWARWQAGGAKIGALRIVVSDVFDLSKPDEHHWVAKAANFVHITTREGVIKRALLFDTGDAVDAAVIHETERLLRALPWIQDASIEPEEIAPGSVGAVVKVHDGWSLEASLKYGHAGGQTDWRIRVHETNFLGLGKGLLLSHEQDIERTTDEFAYLDPMLFGSRWMLEASYQNLSDGQGRLFKLERPFFALSTAWSAGGEASDQELVETLYNDGQSVYSFPAHTEVATLYAHWRYAYSAQARRAWRLGAELWSRQTTYGSLTVLSPPDIPQPDLSERRYRGVLLYWGVSEDRFQTFENLAAVSRVEDINFGWSAEVRAGYLSKALGSLADAWYGEFTTSKGWPLSENGLALLNASARGRLEDGEWHGTLGQAEGTYYNKSLPWQTLAADLQLSAGTRMDPEDALYVGGFDGLRGYPNHYRTGDRRWILSCEDRIVTPWRLWGLAQVGFVAFADAGAIRLPSGEYSKTFSDAGAGLRFGNLKSTFGRVFVVAVAVPLVREPGLDRYQIVVGNIVRF